MGDLALKHRGWDCYYDPPPIPYRGADWTATHPDYDGIGDPRIVTAGSLEALYAEIDEWEARMASEACIKPRAVAISPFLAGLFGLRWILGREGYDPCDEIDPDMVLGLPEGLHFKGGAVTFECRVCGEWTEWPAEIADFDIDNDSNVCGGSPRCCP